ncbi:Bifunctional protein GlmU [subsurface metagenome]
MKNVRAVVLAAGEGTRMRSTLSKLLHLHPISSQALVRFTVNACLESGIEKTIVVVGYQAEENMLLNKLFLFLGVLRVSWW